MDDEQLLSETGRGDKAAFMELFRKYSSPLMGFISRLSGVGNEVEEQLQETMLRIWTKSPLFDPSKGKARSWMYRIAGRVVINWMKAKNARGRNLEVKASTEIEEHPDPDRMPPDEVVIRGEEVRHMMAALTKLPDDLRIALIMRHVEGLGIAEIAEIIEVPEGTVKSRIFNGLKKIRELLVKEDENARKYFL
ncbi:MAG: RNA polymerase sigma factor [Candidatus Riflebacteria bacterium]|nr:RNA polymerase sigma factor [Candidatus Riflebacteria bacterium]